MNMFVELLGVSFFFLSVIRMVVMCYLFFRITKVHVGMCKQGAGDLYLIQPKYIDTWLSVHRQAICKPMATCHVLAFCTDQLLHVIKLVCHVLFFITEGSFLITLISHCAKNWK